MASFGLVFDGSAWRSIDSLAIENVAKAAIVPQDQTASSMVPMPRSRLQPNRSQFVNRSQLANDSAPRSANVDSALGPGV